LLTLGVGQRVGLFAGSRRGQEPRCSARSRGEPSGDRGGGALVGERGREVGDFLAHALGSRPVDASSVVVVATSDAPALERLRAVQVATAVAEHFRDAGASRVLLLVDSVTRVARAQREVGLAAGEPPARRGYPPSVFALLAAPPGAQRAERPGRHHRDLHRPGRGRRHGRAHRRRSARRPGRPHRDGPRASRRAGRYPAIDVPQSPLSRVMDAVVPPPEHAAAARKVRALLAHL
jgi:flagellar biosynthesis/type III secretory pathway ATPase